MFILKPILLHTSLDLIVAFQGGFLVIVFQTTAFIIVQNYQIIGPVGQPGH